MSIGENLKRFRKLKGITQKELATILGVTSITIQNYENNRREPKMDMLNKIADVLDASIFDFIGENHVFKEGDSDALAGDQFKAAINKQEAEENYVKELLKSYGFDVKLLQRSPDMYDLSYKGISRTLGPVEFAALLQDLENNVKATAIYHIFDK